MLSRKPFPKPLQAESRLGTGPGKVPAEWKSAGRGRTVTAMPPLPKHPVIAQDSLAWSYVSLHCDPELEMKAWLDLDWKEIAWTGTTLYKWLVL